MKYRLIVCLLGALPFATLLGQEEVQKAPSTFAIGLNQDNAFGFYPSVFGSFGMTDQVSLSFYGIFWTNPANGILATGTDSWLETGIGVALTTSEDRIYINPSVGFMHGLVLSGASRGRLAEGIVPSTVFIFADGRFELEAFGAYYKALRNDNETSTAGDYLLYWILPGIRVHPNVSLGIHFEGYEQTRATGVEAGTIYQWLGGYLKFTINEQYSFRFSAGRNTANNGLLSDDFYKLALFIPLL